MSNAYVVDTHALFWYLVGSPKLSTTCQQIFQDAFNGQATLILSPIVLVELYGLVQKVGAPFNFTNELPLFEQPPFQIEPIATADLYFFDRLQVIPELHDRLIAAVAYRLGIPILTRDVSITSCVDVQCIW